MPETASVEGESGRSVEAKLLQNENNIDDGEKSNEYKEMPDEDLTMTAEVNKLLKEMPLTEDMTCGFWIFKGSFFQKFANQTVYVLLYGFVGCVLSMTYAYSNGTITTIEKRFKIPSKNTGIITIGNNISQTLLSAFISYYGGKAHRPRLMGVGILTIVAYCLLTAAPHFLYGPGENALALTTDFGELPDGNSTNELIEEQQSKTLCKLTGAGMKCEKGEGNFAPQVVLFIAQFISGIGGTLYYTLGVAYMDDNTKKSKTPALLSLSYFLHMLGPAVGYALASVCLRIYISPHLNPVINNNDPRWLGAWWMGWLIFAVTLFLAALLMAMLPKELPRVVARRIIAKRRKERTLNKSEKDDLTTADVEVKTEAKASFKDMMDTFKRLIKNKTLMYNNISSVFYFFGYTPYWIFTPKYMEIQYRQSAATSSMVTGTVALGFSALGVLLSGFVISKYKPRARYLAAWNVIGGFLTMAGILAYTFIGCPGNERSVIVNIPDSNPLSENNATCNSACHCDYIPYSPVCGANGMTYISACHAGCKKQRIEENGKKIFYDCSCIPNDGFNITTTMTTTTSSLFNFSADSFQGDQATPGACPVNCFAHFVTFLAVMCALKFIGATGRASNFLVSVRCISEKDKTAAMGFGMMMVSLFTFIPSPIFFGWLLDSLCLVWGKTCTNKGNCWLYDPESLRYTLNVTAAVFITIGTLFDCGVWYYVKDLKIFDEENKDAEIEVVPRNDNVTSLETTEKETTFSHK